MRLMACSLPCIVIAVVASTAVAHAAPGSDELEVASPSAPDTNVVQPGNQTDPAVPLSTVLRDRLVRANDVPFETTHYVLTAGLLATGVGFELGLRPTESHWQGGALFDDSARSFVRLRSDEARQNAGTASDVIILGLLAMPLADAAVVAARGDGALAWKMFMIDAESFAMSATVLALTRNLVGRERPYVQDCDSDAAHHGCGTDDARRSFMSGHTAMAFTAAGLICTHHSELDIYGGAADTATCVLATSAAAAVGALRMMADNHYATDVLAGAAVGAFSGFILPRLLHYGFGDGEPGSPSITPFVGTNYGGAVAQGSF